MLMKTAISAKWCTLYCFWRVLSKRGLTIDIWDTVHAVKVKIVIQNWGMVETSNCRWNEQLLDKTNGQLPMNTFADPFTVFIATL